MREQYTIKIENFEGPFDLLFHLIEKNKIDIYDIPIAIITEQYLDYLQSMQEMDLEIASEFLIMAATLLHIKSRMLLPKHKDTDNIEGEIDPREELIARLLEYKRYKDFTIELKEREKLGNLVYYKLPEVLDFQEKHNTQLIGLCVEDLTNAFKRILEKGSKEKQSEPVDFSGILNREKVSVAKKVRDIVKILKDKNKISFNDLFKPKSERVEKIAVFLAVLELIRLRKITVMQTSNFSEIMIIRSEG